VQKNEYWAACDRLDNDSTTTTPTFVNIYRFELLLFMNSVNKQAFPGSVN